MQYDPIKQSLGKIANRTPWLRVLFYRLLHILLLRSWYVRREIRQYVQKSTGPKHVLDAGSGFGQYAWFLSKIAPEWKITGLDVKAEQIRDCNNFFARLGLAGRVSFQQADLTALTDTETYDLIISIDVMEHIPDDTLVFQNFFNALKPSSMLLVSTPSNLGGSDAYHTDDPSFIDEHVRNGYGIDEISQKLRLAGFNKIEAFYTYGKYGHLAWILSMKYPIVLLNQSKFFFLILPLWYLFISLPVLCLNMLDMRKTNNSGTGLIVKAFKE